MKQGLKIQFINTMAVCLGLLGVSTQSAQADIVHLEGTTVDFYYDTAGVNPLFGAIYVSGDTIFATPTSFSASASGGLTDITSATGTIQVIAKTGFNLSGVTVSEGGDYSVSNSTSSVDVGASLRLFDWATPLPGGTEENTNLTLASAFVNDGTLRGWSASGGFDMTTPTWDGISNVGLRLTNVLTATSVDGGTAYIDKSIVGGIGFTFETVVPVPAAVWLFGSGLIGLFGFARRKAHSKS